MNVIQLNRRPPASATSKPDYIHPLLIKCRDRLVKSLKAALSAMMGRVDDALFDLADKAENNTIQTLYFDAMREVRLKRTQIEKRFAENLVTGFERALMPPADARGDTARNGCGESDLLLMDSDELEESLAISTLTGKLRNVCRSELSGLNQRIGYLMEIVDLDSDANPVGPKVISTAFKEACDIIESDLRVRLIVFKLFDKFVAGDVRSTYIDLNQFLKENEILPKLRPAYKRSPAPRPDNRPPAAPVEKTFTAERDPGEQDLLLLYQRAQGVNPNYAGATPVTGSACFDHDLRVYLSNLTVLQRGDVPEVLQQAAGFEALPPAAGTGNILQRLSASELRSPNASKDDMVLDLVAMLFDFVLADKAVPTLIRALIGRLQIPVLKVAILDPLFFAKRTHPARRLINAISHAAIGWDDARGLEDSFYKTVESIVHRITDEFEDDVRIFDDLLTEFNEFLAEEEEKCDRRADETARLLKNKERYLDANRSVVRYIGQQLAAKPLPAFIARFVTNYWKTLLVVTHIRDGEGSYKWRVYTNTLEHLLWSVDETNARAHGRRLISSLPGLVERLITGSSEISMAPKARNRFLDRLSSHHAAIIKAAQLNDQDTSAPAARESAAGMRTVEADLQPDKREQCGETPASDNGHCEAALCAAFGDTEFDIEEITITDRDETEADSTSEIIEDEYTHKVQGIEKGTWLSFKDADGNTSRARLSWISPLTKRYLFTDRRGHKAAEKTLHGLATGMRCGDIEIIDDSSLLDRAVSHLLEGLKTDPSAARVPCGA